MNRIHQIIAALVSLLILFLVIEGGLRLVGLGPKATMNAFDPSLGWTKTPSTSIRRNTGEFDVTFSTNSRGLREDESLGYAKPASPASGQVVEGQLVRRFGPTASAGVSRPPSRAAGPLLAAGAGFLVAGPPGAAVGGGAALLLRTLKKK